MAAKKGKPPKSSFGDEALLDSIFDDTELPVRGKATRSGPLTRTSATDNIFSMLAEQVKKDGDTGDSDVSAADPNDILKNMKDMDDMDADLFASKKKPSSAPAQTKKDSESKVKPEGAGEPAAAGGRKPNSAPSSTAQNYRKFTVSDLDDPLADLLDDLLPDEPKPKPKPRIQPAKPERSPSASPVLKTETSKAAKKQSGLTFDDDKDDLMDALGFESDKNKPKKKEAALWSNAERSETPQRPRTKLDEILESLTSPRLLERPPTGERKDRPPSQEPERTSAVREPLLEDDLTFGSYQPTLGSTPEGRQSRRQSVRFSTGDTGPSTPEKKPKPATPTRQRTSADWLGLKTNDDRTFLMGDAEEAKSSAGSLKAPSSPSLERRPSLTGGPALTDNITKQTTLEVSKGLQREEEKEEEEEEEDDWLAGALSRKKALSKTSKQEDSLGLGEEVDLESPVSQPAPRGREDALTSVQESSALLGPPSPAAHSTPVRETSHPSDSPPPPPPPPPPLLTGLSPVSAASVSHTQPPSRKGPRGPSQASDKNLQQLPSCSVSQTNQMPNTSTAVQQQVTLSADSLQQLLLQQQMMHSQFLGLGSVAVDSRLEEKERHRGDHHALQARVVQLEGQVKSLQLEREQSQMLLESVQQRHKQDMELMENAHKGRVKLLEDSAAQRETQAGKEREDLAERLSAATRSAEQERCELLAQHQRKLALSQQDRDREVERLRDLQRKSILEMKKDHEDQVRRLKKLKDEEIDAVTSATSQTRSLTVVMEQMEQFSSRLGDLSSRVESTHEHTAHGLEQGARHRDEQLRVMQDRLAQQQKAMAEERSYLKEIISRMDTQLNEQQRQLEKERWKMTAEQAKAESTQRGLEGERHALSLQINMEREELERAKSALLEEQKSVMQHFAEERRKLAADWAHFHSLEKQRHERAEREASSLLEKREGSILSLAQDQADLKLHTAELKLKEAAVAQEGETVQRLREELDREKERISSTALRLKTRAHEVEAFSELAAEKHAEGERALREAKRVEAEHQARLGNIRTQTERLRQQEQRLLQERTRLSHLQEDTERLRRNAPMTSSPQVFTSTSPDAGSVLPNPELASTVNIPPAASLASSQSMALQASLALWKYTAEKDREYLQEEQIFLENLKKKSYRSPFNTD
ncbi:fas-binding factor 1 homolog isoform X2 [Cyclopterus lumpus]|uniref:fas-binding factor 1 homolog isoform X2 n=1 Tax=Cyclopterus lumpus TaxID=8103 RepID=UPI0014863CAA|nr:fas-binding factor 1 homolog isoform X2 [Cyclopterus lumpus]